MTTHKQYLSFGERVKIYEFIKTVGKVEEGYWSYNHGWDDHMVSKQLGFTISNVTSVRLELGQLRRAAPYVHAIPKLEKRMLELEGHYRELSDAFQAVSNKIKELSAKIDRLALREHFGAKT